MFTNTGAFLRCSGFLQRGDGEVEAIRTRLPRLFVDPPHFGTFDNRRDYSEITSAI